MNAAALVFAVLGAVITFVGFGVANKFESGLFRLFAKIAALAAGFFSMPAFESVLSVKGASAAGVGLHHDRLLADHAGAGLVGEKQEIASFRGGAFALLLHIRTAMRLSLESLLVVLVSVGPGIALAAGSAAEQCYRLPAHAEAHECLLSREKESSGALVSLEKAFRAALSHWDQEPSYKARSRSYFDSSAESFRRYRVEQCEFLASLAAGGNAAGDRRLLCTIELNEQRIGQLRKATDVLK